MITHVLGAAIRPDLDRHQMSSASKNIREKEKVCFAL